METNKINLMSVISTQLEKVLENLAGDVKEQTTIDFLSGKESPQEFVRTYESRSWLRKHFCVSPSYERFKYTLAKRIIDMKYKKRLLVLTIIFGISFFDHAFGMERKHNKSNEQKKPVLLSELMQSYLSDYYDFFPSTKKTI